MEVRLNINKVNVRPTDKKLKKAKKSAEDFSALPKEMPLSPNYRFNTIMDKIEKIKNSIQTSIDNMRNL